MDAQVRAASRGRPPNLAADPEMAESRSDGGRHMVGDQEGYPARGGGDSRTQKVTWGRRGSGRATGVRSGRSGVAGLRYRNGMAQRDRISVDENLLHQESKDLLALSHIQCIGTPPQLPAECGQGFGELQIPSLIDRSHLQGL